MKHSLTLISACFLLFMLTGCKKTELDGNLSNYEGYWYGSNIEMRLYENGRADYSEHSGSVHKEITNARLIIQKNELKISSMFVNKKFKISRAPYQEDEWWYMELDNQTYVRY
jgi:hypothetical protein